MDENNASNTNASDLSSLVSKLLANPETFSKISNIISNLDLKESNINSPPESNNESNIQDAAPQEAKYSPNSDAQSPTFSNVDIGNILSKAPEILSKFSSFKNENSLADKQQIALLLAIRPYLSERRKELIDSFIKINKFSSIFMSLTKEGDKNVLQ